MDREETLRKAETMLRQGRLESAITEYARAVDDQPRDWATANLLGDLYVRAGQVDRAIAQYARVAEDLARDGFLSKATAFYKKITRIKPDHDTAWTRAADLALQQGLTADARSCLQSLVDQRLKRGDPQGAAKAAVRRAELDPQDIAGHLDLARLLAEIGDVAGAAGQLRAAGDELAAQGRAGEAVRAWHEALRLNQADAATRGRLVKALLDQGDIAGARACAQSAGEQRAVAQRMFDEGQRAAGLELLEEVVTADPGDLETRLVLAERSMEGREFVRARALLGQAADPDDPRVLAAQADLEFQAGRVAEGTNRLQHLLARHPDQMEAVVVMACARAEADREAGFAALSCVLDRAEAAGDVDGELKILRRFAAVAPGHVPALEQLARVSLEGGFEDILYLAETQLADAYLAERRWTDARMLAQGLVSKRPDDRRHRERLREALRGLGVSDTEVEATASVRARPTAPADDLVGFGALPASNPHRQIPAGPFDDGPGQPPVSMAAPPAPDIPPADRGPAAPAGDAQAARLDPGRGRGDAEARPGVSPADGSFEIELSTALNQLAAPEPSVPPAAPLPAPQAVDTGQDLNAFFEELRDSSGRGDAIEDAAKAYDEASEFYNRGQIDQAVHHLRMAARDPGLRFRATSMLARIAREQGHLDDAVEWLERAADAPAPAVEAWHALLYELGDGLERMGEQARAQAVFLELHANAPEYRDVRTRVDRLRATQPSASPHSRSVEGRE